MLKTDSPDRCQNFSMDEKLLEAGIVETQPTLDFLSHTGELGNKNGDIDNETRLI